MLKKVPAISSEVYTALRSSSNDVMRRAAGCWFVFSTFTSRLGREKSATSAPEIIKLNTSKISNNTTRKMALCGLAASSVKGGVCNKWPE